MSKKELRAIAWTGDACTAVATFTDYAKTKKWREAFASADF
jgi:hypothetical protein